MTKHFRVIIPIIICLSVGVIGSLFTAPAIPTWYESLTKPTFSPPNFVFGPVWTTLYILMGVSAYLVWIKGYQKKAVKLALKIFALQLILNFLWSIIFFGFQSPLLALIDIIFLWSAILLTIIKFWKISPIASMLLLPYIAWVSFATILNLSIVLLN